MKTSKADFQLFKDECEYWINYFGLQGWDIVYEFVPIEGGNLAETTIRVFDHCVTIALNSEAGTTSNRIKRAAFHEIDEIRFGRVRELANTRFMNPNDIQEAIHELIVQDENTIYKEKKR